MIRKKTRLTVGQNSGLSATSTAAGIAGISVLAASQAASAQTNFQALPGAEFVIDQASGIARITYQGQMYQVNAGHYQINADGSISISGEAAATVAPGMTTTAVDTFGMPVDSGVLDASADNGFGFFSGDNLLIGASILGVAAAGVGGYFLYQSLTDDEDESDGGSSSGGGSTTPDENAPEMTIAFANSGSIEAGESRLVTFSANEAIAGFSIDDLTVTGGQVFDFEDLGDNDYQVTFLADNSSDAPSVSIQADSFADAAGNNNAAVDAASLTRATVGGGVSITTTGDTLNVTADDLTADVALQLNGVSLTSIDTGQLTGTITLSSIGSGANAVGTLTSSGDIVINGGTDTDTAQALTISNVSSGVDSINATNFDQSLIVSGLTATSTTVVGGSADDQITGGTGTDDITGGGGADVLEGGDGNDTIRGGDGTDRIIGGHGTDQLYGDGGQDTFVFGTGSTGSRIQDEFDTINDLTIGSGADVDRIEVSGHTAMSGSDYIFSTSPADLFQAISEIRYAVLASDQDNQATVFSIDDAFYFYASFAHDSISDDVLVMLDVEGDADIGSINSVGVDLFAFDV